MPQKELDYVRIVRLPPMTMAAYRAESETPENDCSAVINPFVLAHSLQDWSGFRHFGYNKPDPSEGNQVYGYKILIAVPEDFQVPPPLEKRSFDGGLFASIPSTMDVIGERWGKLFHWTKGSQAYDFDMSRQYLEECVDFEAMRKGSGLILDLLMPICERG